MIIDPQAYISFTSDKQHFTPTLINFLEFVKRFVPPKKEYAHFNKGLLERFVWEHNVDLQKSWKFINTNSDGSKGMLMVYDVKECLALLSQVKNIANVQ